MSLDLGAPIRTALLDEPTIEGLLSEYQGVAGIFTRRPAPDGALYPLIIVNPDASLTDRDGLTSDRPLIIKDVIVYGRQPDDYRLVESIGYSIRTLFHRTRFSIDVDGYDVVEIVASGPRIAPTDDDSTVARVVTLTIQLRESP